MCRTYAVLLILLGAFSLMGGAVWSIHALDTDDEEPISFEQFVEAVRWQLIIIDDTAAEELENVAVEIEECDPADTEERTVEFDGLRRVSLDHGISAHFPANYRPERNVLRIGGVTIGFQVIGTRAMVSMSHVHIVIATIRRFAEEAGGEIAELITEYFDRHDPLHVLRDVVASQRTIVDAIECEKERLIAECLLAAKVALLPRGAEHGLQKCSINELRVLIPSPNEEGEMPVMIVAEVYVDKAKKVVSVVISNVHRAQPESITFDEVLSVLSSIRFSVEGAEEDLLDDDKEVGDSDEDAVRHE